MYAPSTSITERDLRNALTTVLSHPNIVGIVRELGPGTIGNSTVDAVISELVSGLLDQRENGCSVIASSISHHMTYRSTIDVAKPHIVDEIQRLCENDTKLDGIRRLLASESSKPVIAHLPTAQVGWCPTNDETEIGPYVCVPMWDTFIAQDGSVLVSYSYVFFESGGEVMIAYTPRRLTRDLTLFPSLNEIIGCLSCDNEYRRLFITIHERLEERLNNKPGIA